MSISVVSSEIESFRSRKVICVVIVISLEGILCGSCALRAIPAWPKLQINGKGCTLQQADLPKSVQGISPSGVLVVSPS